MKQVELYPGVRLNYRMEDRFKNEYLSVNLLCPQGLYKPAAASLLSSVLEKGTARHRNEASLEKAMLDLYGASVGLRGYLSGETYIQPFALTVLDERFLPRSVKDRSSLRSDARDLLFEHLFEPLASNGSFDQKTVSRQKRIKLDLMKAEKADKPRYAARRCIELLCEGEPAAYPRDLFRRELRAITAKELYGYYLEVLSSAPVEIFYFGREELSSLCEDLSRRLAPLFTPKRALTRDVVSPPRTECKRATETVRAAQSVLCVGFKTPVLQDSKDYAAFRVMREVFCDAPTSFLFSEVRERLGLCYYCYPILLPRKGVYMIVAGVEKSCAPLAEKTILKELARLSSGDLEEELFTACRRSILNALKELRDDPVQTEAWYLRTRLGGGPAPEECAEEIEKVTAEEVCRAAASLTPDSVFLLAGAPDGEGA